MESCSHLVANKKSLENLNTLMYKTGSLLILFGQSNLLELLLKLEKLSIDNLEVASSKLFASCEYFA